MTRWLAILVTAVSMLAGVPACAQEDPQNASSYLPLYPPGDVYQIQVIGDGISEGLLAGLNEAFRGDQRVQIKPKAAELATLMRPDFNEQLKALDDLVGRELPTIAVVMIGPQDRVSIKGSNGKKVWIDSDDWRAEFGRQADSVMKLLKRRKMAVYWVSLPIIRRSEPNEDAQVLNEIIREKAYLNGLKYVDAYAGFSDDGGGYSAMGPDLAGKIRLLRENNGISFTDAGNRKLAHFVEREMRRDLTQAKSDRTIPLAGNEAEQTAINANRIAAQKVAKTVAPSAAAGPGVAAAAGDAGAPGQIAGNGDQKADSGRINLALVNPGGREEIVAVDLLRPAIPASVIALVNSKENAEKVTQLGDLLIDQIPGGLMVMSSITPADASGADVRRRLSPTQTPYFRVMVKGERITPKPERSDDVGWPRAEPPVVAEATPPAPAAAQPAKPAADKKAAPAARKKADQGSSSQR